MKTRSYIAKRNTICSCCKAKIRKGEKAFLVRHLNGRMCDLCRQTYKN